MHDLHCIIRIVIKINMITNDSETTASIVAFTSNVIKPQSRYSTVATTADSPQLYPSPRAKILAYKSTQIIRNIYWAEGMHYHCYANEQGSGKQ